MPGVAHALDRTPSLLNINIFLQRKTDKIPGRKFSKKKKNTIFPGMKATKGILSRSVYSV
jgi:hypothetical protein